MKKTNKFALILAMLVMPVLSYGMECGDEDDFRESQTTNWHSLPDEIKLSILSYVVNADKIFTLRGGAACHMFLRIFEQWAQLKLVSSDVNTIASDKQLIDLEKIIKHCIAKKPYLVGALLNKAAKFGHTSLLTMALQNGLDKGIISSDLLEIASQGGHAEFCTKLIELGLLDRKGLNNRALGKAIYLHDHDTVSLWIENEKKRDVATQDQLKVSLERYDNLLLAIRIGDIHAVKLLRELVDLTAPRGILETVLGCAARWNFVDIMKLLIDNGANINEFCQGSTLLIIAARSGSSKVVKFLLKYNVPIDQADSNGTTALMASAVMGMTKIVSILLKNGASVCSRDKASNTALNYAEASGFSEIVKLIQEHQKDLKPQNQQDNCSIS